MCVLLHKFNCHCVHLYKFTFRCVCSLSHIHVHPFVLQYFVAVLIALSVEHWRLWQVHCEQEWGHALEVWMLLKHTDHCCTCHFIEHVRDVKFDDHVPRICLQMHADEMTVRENPHLRQFQINHNFSVFRVHAGPFA